MLTYVFLLWNLGKVWSFSLLLLYISVYIYVHYRLVSSYRTLFWHLFGSSQSGNFEVTFVNKTSGERERMESARNTMVVGEILLLIYHAMAIIVLVNMLIAMMSNSFQTIQVGTCIEYKMFLKE